MPRTRPPDRRDAGDADLAPLRDDRRRNGVVARKETSERR